MAARRAVQAQGHVHAGRALWRLELDAARRPVRAGRVLRRGHRAAGHRAERSEVRRAAPALRGRGPHARHPAAGGRDPVPGHPSPRVVSGRGEDPGRLCGDGRDVATAQHLPGGQPEPEPVHRAPVAAAQLPAGALRVSRAAGDDARRRGRGPESAERVAAPGTAAGSPGLSPPGPAAVRGRAGRRRPAAGRRGPARRPGPGA